MTRYCHRYHVVVAAVFAMSLILPAPLFAQTTPAEAPSTPAASPSTTTQQDAPAVPNPAPAAQPSAPSTDVTLKLPRDLSPWGMFMAADIVVKAVMVGLAFASVLTWTIWFAKAIELMHCASAHASDNRRAQPEPRAGAKRSRASKPATAVPPTCCAQPDTELRLSAGRNISEPG